MITRINGRPAEWTDEIRAKWEAAQPDVERAIAAHNTKNQGETVTDCNYFTTRPYRNEYDRGSGDEGFVYTTNNRHVYQGIIARHPIKREPR
jgi:hypothetical protein